MCKFQNVLKFTHLILECLLLNLCSLKKSYTWRIQKSTKYGRSRLAVNAKLMTLNLKIVGSILPWTLKLFFCWKYQNRKIEIGIREINTFRHRTILALYTLYNTVSAVDNSSFRLLYSLTCSSSTHACAYHSNDRTHYSNKTIRCTNRGKNFLLSTYKIWKVLVSLAKKKIIAKFHVLRLFIPKALIHLHIFQFITAES
jgi:hypothetical protein